MSMEFSPVTPANLEPINQTLEKRAARTVAVEEVGIKEGQHQFVNVLVS